MAKFEITLRTPDGKKKFMIEAFGDHEARQKAVAMSKEMGNKSGEVVSVYMKGDKAMDSIHHVDVDWKGGQRSTYQFTSAKEAVTCAATLAMDFRVHFSAVRGLGMDAPNYSGVLRHLKGIDPSDLSTAEKQMLAGRDPKSVLRDIDFEDMTKAEQKIWKELGGK